MKPRVSILEDDLASEGIGSGVESEPEMPEYANKTPFDPDSISLTTKVVSLDTVLRRLKNTTIVLSPEFQREEVWDKKRKSLLIESMILKIPLPMFYVSEDNDGVWEVVDGLQRLSTIRDFILGEDGDGKGFKLQDLEFWGESLNSKTFYKLLFDSKAARVVNNIMETELLFTVINPGTPDNVKRNIFKRINTGGMRLSDQEIRNALYQGIATKFLRVLSNNEYYTEVTGGTIKDNRMAGRELILRYLAFSLLGRDKFTGDIDDFLSNTMLHLNNEAEFSDLDCASLSSIKYRFELGLYRSYLLFSSHAFRKSVAGARKKTSINKSLFEVWLIILSELDETEFKCLESQSEFFLAKYSDLFHDVDFSNSISRRGGSPWGANFRYSVLKKLVMEFI
ncbi:DUF262 domain-containing protein [Yersinia kristensenii]|uniref:DUF262 domain-containing protein n=1 Tax=Yersinia kristensenii TaxID=28152 RepID=UPI0001A5444B|nr:DUF262 domain-containing protein [Yersinia kristensenii]EEP89545.1 hypothetical protein ykris0001_38320 [Yersinia kristensenii ATCC 33638]PEH52030.1 DUF262 domain-containing protein [Yersinia kristensenii]SUP69816.1 Uncharacterized conserved protein [Yersinia kristensenii]